ncbi:MAG: hypothetical protein JW734_06985 [Candidatus Omnitrophica bacterium]|nr:hypothetical protein [Candidatus Omnitrophota bacterium]
MLKSQGLLKVVLGGVALAHLIIGIVGCLPFIPVERLAAVFYRASVTISPQIEHIVQMFGAYMLTIGVLSIFALIDPVRNKAIITAISFLLFVRVLQRVLFVEQANIIFDIPVGWYWMQTVSFFAVAIALVLLRPKQG